MTPLLILWLKQQLSSVLSFFFLLRYRGSSVLLPSLTDTCLVSQPKSGTRLKCQADLACTFEVQVEWPKTTGCSLEFKGALALAMVQQKKVLGTQVYFPFHQVFKVGLYHLYVIMTCR